MTLPRALAPKHALLFVGIALVSWATVWWLLGRSTPAGPAAPTALPGAGPATQAPGIPGPGDAPHTVHATIPDAAATQRTAADPQPLDETGARERFAQGLRGTVVDEDNRPLAAVAVYLIESAANDPLALPAMLQQGLAPGPTATTTTDSDGTFGVGLPVATERLYEVHLLRRDRADTRVTGIHMLTGQWHDLGTLVMPRGAVVRGRVTVEGSELPVPQAVVTLVAGTAFDDTVLRALPGRENGLTATVDGNGFYEFAHAPMRGAVQLTAVAPGFAAVLRQNIELDATKPLEVNFGLRPGHTLAGTLLDPDNRPVTGARVEAWPMHAAGQPLMVQSQVDGSFAVHGLVTGAHRLRVTARGFQNIDLPDLIPSRHDLQLVLQPRAQLTVTVRDPAGQVLQSYHLAVRRWFAPKDANLTAVSHGDIGLMADVPDQRVRLDRMTDAATVLGVPPGTFVCQVQADGFAKTLSAPFSITSDTRTHAVTVTLDHGANVQGRVLDDAGVPLANATVQTQAAGATPDNPLWRMLAGVTPAKITEQSTRTRADGSFELQRLALGSYDLVVEHPEACRSLVRNLDLHQGGSHALLPVRLARGAQVHGHTRHGGKIRGQMRVILTSAPAASTGPTPEPVRLEALSDENGLYSMPRRVPPGDYELRGIVLVSADPQTQPIHQLLQMQRSAVPFTVRAGHHELELDLDLPDER